MNEMIKLICPICGDSLTENGKTLICPKNHNFDIARQGYVNLLPVQNKKSLNPGDAKEMLLARRDFLNAGHYMPICDSVIRAIQKYINGESPVIADIGCGEGYYTSAFEENCHAVCVGIDIAKDGVKMACSRNKNILWLVATASKLPLKDHSVDGVTAMFSLMLPDEYARILKKGGCVIEVTVGSEHLKELKSIIYDTVFEQHKYPSPCGNRFTEMECNEYRYTMTLNNNELQNLLLMTPHFWRIHKERKEKLQSIESLAVTVHYWVRVLKKK